MIMVLIYDCVNDCFSAPLQSAYVTISKVQTNGAAFWIIMTIIKKYAEREMCDNMWKPFQFKELFQGQKEQFRFQKPSVGAEWDVPFRHFVLHSTFLERVMKVLLVWAIIAGLGPHPPSCQDRLLLSVPYLCRILSTLWFTHHLCRKTNQGDYVNLKPDKSVARFKDGLLRSFYKLITGFFLHL